MPSHIEEYPEDEVPMMSQSIENFHGTKEINFGTETGVSDVQAGIEFIYSMREHTLDIGIATVYALAVYAAVLWITKKIKGYDYE